MASLALVAGLIFVLVLLTGPICLLISKMSFLPNWLIILLGSLTIFIGAWWLLLPIGPIKYIGIITILLGFYSMKSKVKRA